MDYFIFEIHQGIVDFLKQDERRSFYTKDVNFKFIEDEFKSGAYSLEKEALLYRMTSRLKNIEKKV